MADPEHYRHLSRVRMGGWSAYFVVLTQSSSSFMSACSNMGWRSLNKIMYLWGWMFSNSTGPPATIAQIGIDDREPAMDNTRWRQ